MTDHNPLPPFEIVPDEVTGAEERPTGRWGTEGIRINVAISPEDADQIGRVAAQLVAERAGSHKIVWMFFHASAGLADTDDAELIRARYVRDDLREELRPGPLRSERGTFEVRAPHGVITVERSESA